MRIARPAARLPLRTARWRLVLAVVVLLASGESCGTDDSGFTCTATCPGAALSPYSYNWCLSNNVQDALASAGCPDQTQCRRTADACANINFGI